MVRQYVVWCGMAMVLLPPLFLPSRTTGQVLPISETLFDNGCERKWIREDRQKSDCSE